MLRALRTNDLEALRRAFKRLNPEEVELRFLHQSRELPAFIENEVRELDPACDAAFVLEDAGKTRVMKSALSRICTSSLSIRPGPNLA